MSSSRSMSGGARWEERLARRGGAVELLRLPALVFEAAVRARRAGYDRGWLPSERLDVPVISVGNLSVGGTGKTPMCARLVRELEVRGWRPGLLSRGYRAESSSLNDEGRLLARLCPGVAHVQDPDRVRGGRKLVERGADVIVLDDGFQHRRLARDLDIVLVDATRPWGLPPARVGETAVCASLPRGLLREPRSSLARVDAIVITRTEQASGDQLDRLERDLERFAPGKPLVRASHRPRAFRDPRGHESALSTFTGRAVDLVTAIGNPEAFEASVRATGAIVGEHRVFADHHAYTPNDLRGLGSDGRGLVTTSKDAVKLEALVREFFTLEIELDFVSGAGVIEALLDALPHGRAHRERVALHGGLHG